jgi:3-hydroxybutyryl-CoA dehydrogenase
VEIKKIGVVGCGIMGAGIVQVAAQSGFETVVSDKSEQLLQKGLSGIDRILSRSVEKGRITSEEKTLIQKRIQSTTSSEGFADCDYVIEAVPEEIDLKKQIFAQLEEVCPAQTILATNTSVLSVISIASATKRADKVIGTHFANPVPIMKVVEVVKTIATSEETLQATRDLLKAFKKTVVVAKDAPGFLSNRITTPFLLNAVRMLEAGAGTKEDIDTLITEGLGHPMGPLTLLDLIGIDTVYKGAMAIYKELRDPQYFPPVLMRQMIDMGWLGRKTGRGFYDYSK